uniref:Transthyretin-like family protein n=1 Tax=Ascaris lumbricoides TaxID=6252 RepID=A0A0M3I1R7_ASCLU
MFLRGALLLLAFASTAFCMFGRMKNVTARGQLLCGARNYANGKVELWEDDTLNFDDLLNTTNSNSLGRFSIYGQTREVRNIEPYLLITHNCDNGILNTVIAYQFLKRRYSQLLVEKIILLIRKHASQEIVLPSLGYPAKMMKEKQLQLLTTEQSLHAGSR